MNINECTLHNIRKLRKNRFMYKLIVHCNVSDTVFVFTCVLKRITKKHCWMIFKYAVACIVWHQSHSVKKKLIYNQGRRLVLSYRVN